MIFCPENLWYRQGVTPSYPQGSSWQHISNNVRKVSVGPLDQVITMISIPRFDLFCFFTVCISRTCFFILTGFLFFPMQVWIIADKVQGSQSLSHGTVCHRLGVQPLTPKGQSWDYGIGVRHQRFLPDVSLSTFLNCGWYFKNLFCLDFRVDGTTSQ